MAERDRSHGFLDTGVDSTETRDDQNVAARHAWGFDDLERNFGGVITDALSIVRPAARVSFDVAGTATTVGFSGATAALRRVGDTIERQGFPRIAKVARLGESGVRCTWQGLRRLQNIAKHITLGALDGAIQNLHNAGAERGIVARWTLGAEEVAACLTIANTASQVSGSLGLSSAIRSPAKLAHGFLNYALTQGPCSPSSYTQVIANSDREVESLGHLMWCCAAVYGWTLNMALGLFSRYPANNFIREALSAHGFLVILDRLANQQSQMYQPGLLVLLDEKKQALVVVLRGTSNIRDTLTDLVCEPMQLVDYELCIGTTRASTVHKGMWQAATIIKSQLDDVIHEALRQRPHFKLVITGHSLGAGVATLLCLLWRSEYQERASCAAFGPPAILDLAASKAAEHEGITSIVVGEDFVPRLSLRSATDLSLTVVQNAQISTSQTNQPRAKALYPAGRLLHVHTGHRSGHDIRVVGQEMFEAIRVHHMMLLDHLPRSYLRGLGQL